MLSAYLEWVGELASITAQAIGQSIAINLNKSTDHWSHTAIKFCVFAVIYPLLTVGVVGVSLWLAILALELIF
jgi:nitrate reductase NapE component